jgi:hypothetical protein
MDELIVTPIDDDIKSARQEARRNFRTTMADPTEVERMLCVSRLKRKATTPSQLLVEKLLFKKAWPRG